MKIRDLSMWESFDRVANEENFARAAKMLRIGPSLLSKRIKALEDELGVRLFQRSTRKVSLTQEGRALLPRVKALLEDAKGLEDQFEAEREVAGTIRMTCLPAFANRVIAPLIADFSRRYPKVEFEIDASEGIVDLIDSQMDLAIRVQAPEGADFVFKELIENRLVLCASPAYLKKARHRVQGPADLKHHRILTLPVYAGCRFKNSSLTLGDLAGSVKIRAESGAFLTELARAGAGIAVRSLWDVRPFLDSGELVRVLAKDVIEPFGHVYAVIPNRRLVSRRVRAFVDDLSEAAKGWKF